QKFPQLIVDMPEQASDILQVYVLGMFANLQTEKAFHLLGDWEASSPQDSQPKFLQAYLYQGINRLDLAANAYRAGLKLSKDSTLMRRRLGQVLLEAGKTDEALVELQQCLQASPNDVEVHYLLAQVAQQQNDLDTALQELDSVLASSPSHVDAQCLRGQVYLDKGDPQAALADLQAVATVHPDDTVAREALGRALKAVGRSEEAKTNFDYVSAATAFQSETGRLIRQVLAEPENAELRFEIALRLLQSGDLEDGAKWLRTVLELQPDHNAAHLAMADVLERAGDSRNAALHRQVANQSERDVKP
ncbi:MAG: tetratricopeptide repeat protein, partial [Aureliella sp.]